MSRKNPILKVLVGPSCVGKSTWAAKQDGYVVVSRDTLREELFGEYRMGSFKEEELITKLSDDIVNRLLEYKRNVILDNTHLKLKYIEDVVEKFNYLADIEVVVFSLPTDIQVLKDREFNRRLNTDKEIPHNVIDRQINQYKSLISQGLTLKYPRINNAVRFENLSKDKPDVYICDIDGTLSSSEHRNIYTCTDEEIMEDKVITPVAEIIKLLMLSEDSNSTVIFMSGRSNKYYKITDEWLKTKVLNLPNYRLPYFSLFMRKEGDNRPDSIVKKEMFDEHVKDKYNVLGVFDDRKVMVEFWNNLGIFTFDVGQGKNYF
jgi:predicted kinase